MDTEAWRQRLREFAGELASESRAAASRDAGVREAYADAARALGRLDAALAESQTTTSVLPSPIEVAAPVLGVDGCKAGWVGAVLEPGAPRPRVVVAPTISELVAMVRESLGIRVVGIDIPIGLPDSTIRRADQLARNALPGKSSSIFSTLTRAAYLADTRLEADAVNRGLVGQGVGAQAFALRDKIVEVDAWMRTRPTVTVLEVHPELSFAAMTGAPIKASKKTDEGRAQRLAALADAGLGRPSVIEGQGYAADDVLDACAVAWTAARHAAGLARPLPDPPETFSDGIPAAIWA
jgi:predicted RNase H-like nuclease